MTGDEIVILLLTLTSLAGAFGTLWMSRALERSAKAHQKTIDRNRVIIDQWGDTIKQWQETIAWWKVTQSQNARLLDRNKALRETLASRVETQDALVKAVLGIPEDEVLRSAGLDGEAE